MLAADAKRLQFALATSPYVIEKGQAAGGMYATMVVLSNLDSAIVGLHESEIVPPAVIYSTALILKQLEKDGMPAEDSEEYFRFNVIGSYMGAQTPRYVCKDYNCEDDEEPQWVYDQ